MSSKNAPETPGPSPAGWSLATRLTLWYAASAFVLIAASAGFMYWALTGKLESEDDQFMAEKVEIVRALLRGRSDWPVVLPGEGELREAGRPPASASRRVLAAGGGVLLTTAGMDATLPETLFPPSRRGRPARPPAGRVRGSARPPGSGRSPSPLPGCAGASRRPRRRRPGAGRPPPRRP